MRRLTYLALAVVTVIGLAAPASAQGVDFSVFGSYYKLSTTGGTEELGAGARVGFGDFFDHMQVNLTGTWYDTFGARVFGEGLTEDVTGQVEVYPFDLGVTWYLDPDNVGFYIGAGFVYYRTDVKNTPEYPEARFKDDYGYFASAGYQMRNMGLFFEAIYRNGDAKIEGDFPNGEGPFTADVGGFGLNVGWKF